MSCLNCKNASFGALKFLVLEVHTLHIRDFDGERVIQALGDFGNYDICTACAETEARAVLFPARRIAAKCLPFVILAVIGTVLTLAVTFRDVMAAFRIIGPLAAIVGIMGAVSNAREILRERETVGEMNHEEALRYSAWQLLLRNAPKKYGDNDITYIPVNDDTLNMTDGELTDRYGLLPSISAKAHEIMYKGE